MTSKFKALTGPTPPSSLEGGTEGPERPSKQSVEKTIKEDSIPSTQTLRKPLPSTSKIETNASAVSEKVRMHAYLLIPLLSSLEKAGLVRRYKVSSKEGEWMETQIVFERAFWDENLILQLLSDAPKPPTTVEGE